MNRLNSHEYPASWSDPLLRAVHLPVLYGPTLFYGSSPIPLRRITLAPASRASDLLVPAAAGLSAFRCPCPSLAS